MLWDKLWFLIESRERTFWLSHEFGTDFCTYCVILKWNPMPKFSILHFFRIVFWFTLFFFRILFFAKTDSSSSLHTICVAFFVVLYQHFSNSSFTRRVAGTEIHVKFIRVAKRSLSQLEWKGKFLYFFLFLTKGINKQTKKI